MSTREISPTSTLRQKAQLMSDTQMERTLVRIALEIVEANDGPENLVLVGIRRRGVPLAQRLEKLIQRMERVSVPVGTLDITFYRDDLSTVDVKPVVNQSELGVDIEGKNVVL